GVSAIGGRSPVLKIDPTTNEIEWKFQEVRVSDFFSPRISNSNVGRHQPGLVRLILRGHPRGLRRLGVRLSVLWRGAATRDQCRAACLIPPRKSRGPSLP